MAVLQLLLLQLSVLLRQLWLCSVIETQNFDGIVKELELILSDK